MRTPEMVGFIKVHSLNNYTIEGSSDLEGKIFQDIYDILG